MLKLVSFHIQEHLNAFIQILECYLQTIVCGLQRQNTPVFFCVKYVVKSYCNISVLLYQKYPHQITVCLKKFSHKLSGFSEKCIKIFIFLKLTAFNLNVTELSVHGEVLEVHWAGCGNGQPESHRLQPNQCTEYQTLLLYNETYQYCLV